MWRPREVNGTAIRRRRTSLCWCWAPVRSPAVYALRSDYIRIMSGRVIQSSELVDGLDVRKPPLHFIFIGGQLKPARGSAVSRTAIDAGLGGFYLVVLSGGRTALVIELNVRLDLG